MDWLISTTIFAKCLNVTLPSRPCNAPRHWNEVECAKVANSQAVHNIRTCSQKHFRYGRSLPCHGDSSDSDDPFQGYRIRPVHTWALRWERYAGPSTSETDDWDRFLGTSNRLERKLMRRPRGIGAQRRAHCTPPEIITYERMFTLTAIPPGPLFLVSPRIIGETWRHV